MNSNKKRIDTICFGGEDWWYHNRAHIDMQLMRRFTKNGTVLYVNSLVMQKPNLGEGGMFFRRLVRKSKSIFRGLQKSHVGFWVYSPFSLPVHHIGWLRKLNEIILRLQIWFVMWKLKIRNPIVWIACPAACDIAINIKRTKLVYQRTDRFEEYPNVDTEIITRYDRELKANADLTIFVNKTLFDEESNHCRKALYLDHGVDFDLFAGAETDSTVPDDMKGIERPVVGFFGDIDSQTTDMELMEKLTELLPQMNFVFVGKATVDCSALASRKNVHMLGYKPYEQIPHYGKCFDVAIMPWRQNRWIEACNPIKLKEYLALGKPVVSTPFPELQKYLDVVYKAVNPQEFAENIERALFENHASQVAARRAKVENTTWDSKSQLVLCQLFDNND